MSGPQPELTPDEQLGLDAPAPSPDARNQVALRRLYAPIAVATLGVAVVAYISNQLPPVPSFAGTVAVDGALVKGPAPAGLKSKLDVALKPQGDPGGPIAAYVYTSRDGHTERALDAHPVVDDKGGVFLVGPVGDLLGSKPGPVQVILLIVRPNAFPETPAAVLGEGPWHAQRFTLNISG